MSCPGSDGCSYLGEGHSAFALSSIPSNKSQLLIDPLATTQSSVTLTAGHIGALANVHMKIKHLANFKAEKADRIHPVFKTSGSNNNPRNSASSFWLFETILSLIYWSMLEKTVQAKNNASNYAIPAFQPSDNYNVLFWENLICLSPSSLVI